MKKINLDKLSKDKLLKLKKKVMKQEKRIQEAIKKDKTIKKWKRELKRIEKKLIKIDNKIRKRNMEKVKLVLKNEKRFPYFSYSNIRKEVFQAIKNAGFDVKMLRKSQIENCAEQICWKLRLTDEVTQKLITEESKLYRRKDEIEEKILKRKDKIRRKFEKIKTSLWAIEYVLVKLKEKEKKVDEEKMEKERERFDASFDEVYEKFKELLER